MTAIKWKTGTTADWNVASNWAPGAVPGASDAVTIAASGTYAVFIDDAESAASVLLNSASATLLVEGGPGVALTLGTSLTANAGTLSLVADDTSSYGSITGGTVTVNAGANLFAQSFTQDPNFSTFEIDSAVNIAGHAVVASDTDLLFVGGGSLTGSFSGPGEITLTSAHFTSVHQTYTSSAAALTALGTVTLDNYATLKLAATTNGTLAASIFAADNATLTASASSTLLLSGATDITYDAHVLLGTGSKVTLANSLQIDNSAQIYVPATTNLTTTSSFSVGLGSLFGFGDTEFDTVVYGGGTLTTTGQTVVADPGSGQDELFVGEGLTWSNTGTVELFGHVAMNPVAGDHFTFSNGASGVFNLETEDAGLIQHDTDGSDLLTNAGTIGRGLDPNESSDTGTSTIAAAVNSTGTIDVEEGTLAFTGGGTLSGLLSGAGTLLLYAGSYTVGALSGGGHLALGPNVTLNGSPVISSAVTLDGGQTLTAASGNTLTLAGQFTIADSTGSGTLAGAGQLITSGTTTINDLGYGGLAISVEDNWTNSGTVNDGGYGFLDQPGGGAPPTIVNTGTFDFVGDDSALMLDTRGGGAPASIFTSTGTLAKTTGTGISTLAGRVIDTGVTSVVASGTLAFTGGGIIGGTLNVGMLELAAGAFTTSGVAGAGLLNVNNASLTGTANGTITAAVHAANAGTIAVATAKTVALAGPVGIGDASGGGVVFGGPGTLATTGVTTINDLGYGALALSVTGNWANSGTVNDLGFGFFDQPGGGAPGSIVNTGTVNFAGDDASLMLDTRGGGAPAGTLTSTGTLGKTGGTGISIIAGRVLDTGTTNVATGTLALTGGGTASGTLTGAGVLDLGGGTFTTTGLSGAGNLAITNATLTGSVTSAITASVHAAASGTISAAIGKTLTLSGPVGIGDASGGGVVFGGPGTLATTGVTTINDLGYGALALSVTGNWANSGTVNDLGFGFFDQPGGGAPGSIVNTGTFNFAGDDASLMLDTRGGGAPAGTFTSTGTLGKTGGTGISTIAGRVLDTGTTSIVSGTLALTGGGSASGTLTGVGTLDLGGGAFTTAGLSGAGTLAVIGASLTASVTSTITASVHAAASGTLAAAPGKTLTLSGPVSIGDASGGGVVFAGAGTLATSGVTTIGDLGFGALAFSVADSWTNSGTVHDGGYTFFDVPGGGLPGLLVNSGTFDLTSDDASIQLDTRGGGAPAGRITNSGTLSKTGGTGTSTIAAGITLANTGVIEAASGTLVLGNAVTGTGAMRIDAGATLDVQALPASQSVTFTGGGGATLKLETPASRSLTGFTAGDRLDLVASVSGVSISGTTLTVTTSTGSLAFVSAGIAGEVATFAGDSSTGTYVSLYRGAIATHTPEPLAFGNLHVGSTTGTTAFLTVVNTAPADGYSETLNAGFGAASPGFSATGSVTGLAAGASNGTSLTASIDASTAGAKSGTATLTLASNGAGVDGRATTALPNQTVNLTGGIYAYAAASLSSASVALGNQHVGAAPSASLTLTNTAAATGGYTEALDARFSGSSGSATGSGTASLIAAGASTTSLSVGLAPGAAGVVSGIETLTTVSDGAGTSGLGTTVLGTQTVSITGTYYNLASGTVSPGVVALGNHHVGDIATQTLSLTNTAATGAYSEALDATLAASGAVSASGSIVGLLAGGTDASDLKVTANTASAGAISGSLVLGLTSDGTTISDGLGTTALASQTLTVSGATYAFAAGAPGGATLNLGVIHASTLATGALSLTNTAAAGAYSEALDAGLSGASAGLSASGSITGLLAGNIDTTTLRLGVNTAATGSYTGTATLNLTSDGAAIGDGLGTTTLTGQSVTVSATVDSYALAAFEDPSGPTLTGTSTNETLNLGSTLQGGAALSANLGVLNAAAGLADLLGGTLTSAGGAGFTNTGLGSFSGLGAGQDEHAQTISLSTSNAGTFTETVLLTSAGSNASGYTGALANETLTITGTITPSVTTTYTLDSGPNVILGANGMGDVFLAGGGTLNSRDQLTGGSGANSVNFLGGGTFDVNALRVFSNIPTLNATEGQAASGTLAATVQTVLLTDIANETLNVAAGRAAAGNGNAETIRIFGSASTNTINLAGGTDRVTLANGHDTINLGGSANSVMGGTGTALVRSTAANAGAAIVGSSGGTLSLEITNAGTVTLNAADTNIHIQLDAAGTLKLSTLAFITAAGSSGADTLTALGGTQTLTGGLGADTLTGYTGGSDSFADTAAGLNGDTIKNWTTGDVIDVKDFSAASLAYAASSLTISNAGSSTAIKFGTGLALHNFAMIGSDGNGGTLIAYHT